MPFSRFRISTAPVKLSPRKKSLTAIERRYVDTALDKLEQEGDLQNYHQLRWIWCALKWTAMRRNELSQACAGDIYQEDDENGAPTWKIAIQGKGNTNASVPLSSEFLKEFALYRAHHGLPSLPVFGSAGEPDSTPLVLPIRGGIRHVNDHLIYRAMKDLMTLAATVAEADGNLNSAGRLLGFAAHSARHTSITAIVDATGDITLGQDMARHASITTTRAYKAPSTSRLKGALEGLKNL